MAKRTDISKVLMIGSGPIIIGQAAEFDFSGTQACRSLKEEGYEVVLINSNPATIMTDPDTADKIYVEPITIETVIKVLKKEKPDGILAGMGGQTALNICSELERRGVQRCPQVFRQCRARRNGRQGLLGHHEQGLSYNQ